MSTAVPQAGAAPAGSISSMLERSLDLISEELSGSAPGQPKSAARALMEERKKVQALAIDNSFSFQPRAQPSATGSLPLLQQISSSTVQAPKYWSGATKKHGKVEKASSNKAAKAKGESYNNRFQEKLAAKAAKAKMKNKLKSS